MCGSKVGSVRRGDFADGMSIIALQYGQEFDAEPRAWVCVYHAGGKSESQIYGGNNKIGVW